MAPFTFSEHVRTIESLRSERLPEYRFQFPSQVKIADTSKPWPAGSALSLRRNVHDRGWKATDHIRRIETHEQDEVRCAGGCDDA